jgi:myo-inositol-1-phosphate synthase
LAKATVEIKPAQGKLGILLPGMGAVTSTFIAGVEAVKRGISKPIGSLTQMGTIRLGKRTDKRSPFIKDFVPLAKLEDLVFGGWDIFEDDCYAAGMKAGVLEPRLLEQVKEPMQAIKPWKAVFDQNYVKRLNGPNVKSGNSKMDLAQMVRDDIRTFKQKHNLSRLVMIWCGSTEIFMPPNDPAYNTIASFEKALRENNPAIAPSMIYAYAACKRAFRSPTARRI